MDSFILRYTELHWATFWLQKSKELKLWSFDDTSKKSIYFLYPEMWSLWGFLPVLLTVVSGKELYHLDYQKRFKNTITTLFSV